MRVRKGIRNLYVLCAGIGIVCILSLAPFGYAQDGGDGGGDAGGGGDSGGYSASSSGDSGDSGGAPAPQLGDSGDSAGEVMNGAPAADETPALADDSTALDAPAPVAPGGDEAPAPGSGDAGAPLGAPAQDDAPAPTNDAPTPTNNAPTPTNTTTAPTDGTPAPTNNGPAPTGQAAPTADQNTLGNVNTQAPAPTGTQAPAPTVTNDPSIAQQLAQANQAVQQQIATGLPPTAAPTSLAGTPFPTTGVPQPTGPIVSSAPVTQTTQTGAVPGPILSVGALPGIKGRTVTDILTRIPGNATGKPLKPSTKGGAQIGWQWTWTENGWKVVVRIHGADGTAPPGSNAAQGWVIRIGVQKDIAGQPPGTQGSGIWYMDDQGNWWRASTIKDPNNPEGDLIANATHIPIAGNPAATTTTTSSATPSPLPWAVGPIK